MVSRTSRRLAAPALVACVGVLGSAATAHAQGSGGLSVTPAILEHRAAVGGVGSMTLTNTTKETLRVTVRVRPWRQELERPRLHRRPLDALALRAREPSLVPDRPPAPSVPLSFRMLRRTSSGSLYGNVDVLGKPINTKGRKGIIPQYRLISTLRLHPSRKSHRLRTGAAQVRGGQVLLPVRNLGNTIDPIGGSFQHHRPDGAQRHVQGRRGAARQADRARRRRHARAQEGPLHAQRDRHPGRPPRRPRAPASRFAELSSTGAVSPERLAPVRPHLREERRRERRAEAEEPAPAPEATSLLALQRTAGNAAVAAYLQRAAIGWKPDGIAINTGQKASGGFTRFPVDGLSTGLAPDPAIDKFEEAKGDWPSATAHTSEKPYNRSVVLVPTNLLNNPPAEIDVLFHLHGHGIGWREGTKEADDKSAPVGFAYKGKVRDEVADDIAGQLPKDMVAVMPQGHRKSNFGSVDPPKMIDEALHAVPGWDKVKPRRVVLGAYSGGGGSVAGLLGSGKDKAADRQAERMKDLKGLSEVALFDAINGRKSELPAAISFVNDQIDVDIGRLSADPDVAKQKAYLKSSMRFRGFFTAGSGLYNPLYTSLFQDTVLAKGLWQGTPDSQKHGTVPKALAAKISQPVWELLADELRDRAARPGASDQGRRRQPGRGDEGA